ncbi:MAG: glycoside hydrolase family 88 protein [Acidobacteriaceae bacterium]
MQRAADAALARFAQSSPSQSWNSGLGTLLAGMDAAWAYTANGQYYEFVRRSVDPFVSSDGTIAAFDRPADSCSRALLARQFLLLYRVTQDKKYFLAAKTLRTEVAGETNSASAGERSLPIDSLHPGLCPVDPFLAEYASVFQEPQLRPQITRQLLLMDRPTSVVQTETPRSRNEANPSSSGPSLRSLATTMTALVDALPFYPQSDPGRGSLLAILHQTAAAVIRAQDPHTGLWTRTLVRPDAQASDIDCLLTYALAKSVRLGYLPRADLPSTERAWLAIRNKWHGDGDETLPGSTGHSDSASTATGAFLLAASEMTLQPRAIEGLGSNVLLDAWYNSQRRENAAGQSQLFHYKWDDDSDSGFSAFGHIFRRYGMTTSTLESAPTFAKLREAQYYIIVSPDNPAKNPHPHYMNAADAAQIAAWVRSGGVLLMMENDPANADILHMDILADRFGLHFNNVLVHHVIGDRFDMGRIDVPSAAPPFTHPHLLYMKDTCSLALSKDAKPLLQWQGDTLMAFEKYGKGTVVAVTDPWLYNEYTDGRKLPLDYDNFAAGVELVHWLLQQR